MKIVASLLVVLGLAASVLAAPIDDLDRDGRTAFAALRQFQKLELAAFTSQARWPTGEQHLQITRLLEAAYDGIHRGLALSVHPAPQVVSFMRQANKAVVDLALYTTPHDDQPVAPAAVLKAFVKARGAYAKVLEAFPYVPVTDEQLTR